MRSESYPPPFRSNTLLSELPLNHGALIVDDSDSDPIPVVDLGCLELDHDFELLVEACKQWGVFRLVNHGVPESLLSQVQYHARRLFALPFETKQALLTSPMSYFWGTPALTPAGTPLSVAATPASIHRNVNWVEGFNVPLSQLSQVQTDHPMITSFRHELEEYGRHLGRIGRALFDSMSKNLCLSESKLLSESTGFVRVYRYPVCSVRSKNEKESAWGMDVHTDSSVLSILNQDEVGGLQVLKDNKWFTVKPIPNTLIVNLGDMMQAISNDEYTSVKHRVKVNEYRERISICYFVFPGEGSVIRSSKYKPFTYSEFQAQVQQDVKTFGHKVGLNRFKLSDAC